MSIKKLKGFKFFPEFITKLTKHAKKFNVPETTIVEASVETFFALSESQQKEILKKYLTKDL